MHYQFKIYSKPIQALSDKMKKTGIGKQKPLSEFNELCLEFVKQAKGKYAVDYIPSVSEPDGTNLSSSSVDRAAYTSHNIQIPIGPKKKKKNGTISNLSTKENITVGSSWKQELIDHIKDSDASRISAELKVFKLKEYNLVLRNLQLERELSLGRNEIINLRNDINPELNSYPQFSTEAASGESATDESIAS